MILKCHIMSHLFMIEMSHLFMIDILICQKVKKRKRLTAYTMWCNSVRYKVLNENPGIGKKENIPQDSLDKKKQSTNVHVFCMNNMEISKICTVVHGKVYIL